jgi:glycerol-3-phosphate dehydrogenase
MDIKTEVLIVGGGATGVGISRDLSLRGIPCLLVEKGDFASGASGRNHGLFHSGARYAVSDPEAARECISENRILRRIAPHCIEETGGLFISLQEDGLDFRDQFVRACERVGIPATPLSRDEALASEPKLNPHLLSAVKVPDGAIDPFALVLDNVRGAKEHGAKFFLHTEITSLMLDKDVVRGAMAKDLISGEEYSIESSYTVNATGAWANQFLKLVGLHIEMALSKGSMLITNQRLNHRVINRCRPPSNGDIIVPNDTVSILGTTSIRSGEVENFQVTPLEVSLLIEETSKLVPAISEARLIRAYAGIRPLFQSMQEENDRVVSRGFALIDHGMRDGIQHLITIIGGKLVTHRLMAEKASNLICQKMGVSAACVTHLRSLPGASPPSAQRERLKGIGQDSSGDGAETLCDCEMIGREEVEKTLKEENLRDLQDILHRTRLAKGTCQGGFCIYRLLGMLHDLRMTQVNSNEILKGFLEERWKGIRPVLWGTSLGEEELVESIYKGIFNL